MSIQHYPNEIFINFQTAFFLQHILLICGSPRSRVHHLVTTHSTIMMFDPFYAVNLSPLFIMPRCSFWFVNSQKMHHHFHHQYNPILTSSPTITSPHLPSHYSAYHIYFTITHSTLIQYLTTTKSPFPPHPHQNVLLGNLPIPHLSIRAD